MSETASNVFAVLTWVLLALGALVDAFNALYLAHKLIHRRYISAVWVVPLVFYGMAAACRRAAALPTSWGLAGALVLIHVALMTAHILTGRPK